MKLWVLMNQRSGLLTRNSEIMVAVLSRFEGPKAGHWAQAKLDHYMAPGVDYPTWDELQAKITGYFVPGNNADWAKSQLLKLRQCKWLLALITDSHTLNEHYLCYIEGR